MAIPCINVKDVSLRQVASVCIARCHDADFQCPAREHTVPDKSYISPVQCSDLKQNVKYYREKNL